MDWCQSDNVQVIDWCQSDNVQVIDWCPSDNKSLSELMTSLFTVAYVRLSASMSWSRYHISILKIIFITYQMIICWIYWNQEIGWYKMIPLNPNQSCRRLDSWHTVVEVNRIHSCYTTVSYNTELHIDGLVQDCSISIAVAVEILRPCIKPSI